MRTVTDEVWFLMNQQQISTYADYLINYIDEHLFITKDSITYYQDNEHAIFDINTGKSRTKLMFDIAESDTTAMQNYFKWQD